MRAVVMHESGGPEVLRYEQAPDPTPGEGEVLVRVRAVGINAIDWKFRRGVLAKPLPAILGSDVSGTVEVSHSPRFAQGAEVFGLASGGYAELAVAAAERLAEKPARLRHAQAAALPVAGLTAWQALFDAGELHSGQRVLIAGAAGGVGHLAVQFAKLAGAHTIGTGSERNREHVLGLGADEYVDYTQQDVAQAARDVDLAFDTVGGDATAALLRTLRPGGRLVTIAGEADERTAAKLGVRAQFTVMSPNADQLRRIAELVAGEQVQVEIAQELPLTQASRAHELIESRRTRGKIVLTAPA